MPLTRTAARRDQGAVAIVVAIFTLVAMVLLAFVIDRGRIYTTQAQLQNAADAAALAGAESLCGGVGDPVTVARTYAGSNGVPPANVQIATSQNVPTVNGDTSYINVRANENLSLFFGPFVNTSGAAVAAQATAALPCQTRFQYVSTRWFEITGANNVFNANVYAGVCFNGSTNSTYNAKIAVSSFATFGFPAGTDCNDIENRFAAEQINLGTSPTIGPNYQAIYNSPIVTAQSAYQDSDVWNRYPNTDPQVVRPANTTCSTYAGDFSTVLSCSGTGKLQVKNSDVVRADVLATGEIDFNNGATFAPDPTPGSVSAGDWILVYSNYSGTQPAITLPNVVPAHVIVYAPRGRVKFTGSGADMLGSVFANDIELSGGGANAASGSFIDQRGTVTLIQ